MKVRFLADESLNHDVVTILRRREPELDVLTAHQAGLRGRPDEWINRITYLPA